MRILAGRFRGRALPVPPGARPAGSRLRTSLFSVLGGRVEGARVLDVCAGAGGLGLEALSRGARHVTLLERDPGAARALEAWLARVGAAGEAQVLRLDVRRRPWPAGPFDLVLLDPPFDAWAGPEAAEMLARARSVVAPEGLLVVKCPSRQVLPAEGPVGASWKTLDRRSAGEAAYALLAPA